MLAASLLLNNDLCTSLDTGAVADVEINEGLSSTANNKEPDVANQSGSAGTATPTPTASRSSDSLQHTVKVAEMSGGSTHFAITKKPRRERNYQQAVRALQGFLGI